MDGVTLDDLRARRAALDEEIRVTEMRERASWNEALEDRMAHLQDWMREHAVEVSSRDRKNAVIWDCGNGALEVTFVYNDQKYGPGALRMTSGCRETVTLEWNHVPEAARLLSIVAVLMNAGQ